MKRSCPALLDQILEGAAPSAIPGAVYREASGSIVALPAKPCTLDQLPAPKRRFFDHARYFREGGQAGLETKRGCAGTCIYCPEPKAKGRRVVCRNPASLVAELEDLLDQGVDVVHLCDSEFNHPPAHARAFCEALITAGLHQRLRWYAYCSPEAFDMDLAILMRQAGCVGINFGVDHGDAAMLRRLGRNYGPDQVRRTVAACKQSGIAVMYDLLLGGPGESRASLRCALDLMRETGGRPRRPFLRGARLSTYPPRPNGSGPRLSRQEPPLAWRG